MSNNDKPFYRRLIPALLVTVGLCCEMSSWGQSFTSGSTGVDGDLIVNTPGLTPFTQTPSGGGNVFNFKSIQIAAGSTLSLSGQTYQNPLYFLAQNAVAINGAISLDGGAGYVGSLQPDVRAPSVPGAGGYPGGVGPFGSSPAQPGGGPGGGDATCGGGGSFTGNSFLVPLVGGSGGGGDGNGGGGIGNVGGSGGGAGGGALLIASDSSITLNGTISANGGAGGSLGNNTGGGGSGGAIRLVAPTIAGAGATISAAGGGPPPFFGCDNGSNAGGNGLIRIEAFQNTLVFQNPLAPNGSPTPVVFGSPFGVFPPSTPPPSLQVLSIGGVSVPASPTGSFTMPDVVVNSNSSLVFDIQATNIPVGTTATVIILSENGPDQTLTSTPLSGSLASSTATASATLPSGYSRGYVKATWTQ